MRPADRQAPVELVVRHALDRPCVAAQVRTGITAQAAGQGATVETAPFGNGQQCIGTPQVFTAHKVGAEQTLQQGITLGSTAQYSRLLHQAMGVGGVGHPLDTAQVDADTDRSRGLLHLGLTHAHSLDAA
ncbi:hypothetical protein D3C72_1883400 [compost metagenome]